MAFIEKKTLLRRALTRILVDAPLEATLKAILDEYLSKISGKLPAILQLGCKPSIPFRYFYSHSFVLIWFLGSHSLVFPLLFLISSSRIALHTVQFTEINEL